MTSSRTTIRFTSSTVTPPPDDPVGERYLGVAELPRTRYTAPFALPTGTRRYVTGDGSSSNLQAQLNAAQRGDVIVIPAGVVLTREFIIPEKPGTGAIYVVAQGIVDNTFPVPEGQRVTEAQASAMPTLRITSSSRNAIRAQGGGVSEWRFVGLRFDIAPEVAHPAAVNAIVAIGHGSDEGWTVGWPSQITFDRCLWVGLPTQTIQRGLQAHGTQLYITGCSFVGINARGMDGQCIGGWKQVRDVHVENCYFEGAVENIMWGGARPNQGPEHRYTDITVRRCHFHWARWRHAADPSYRGINYALKNHFELKGGTRILLEDNLFEDFWYEEQPALILLRNVEVTGSQYVEDVVVRYNVGERVQTFASTAWTYAEGGFVGRIVLAHNLVLPHTVYADGWRLIGGREVLVQNNTYLNAAGPGGVVFNRTGLNPYTWITNNLLHHGNGGIVVTGVSGPTRCLYAATSGSVADGSKTTFARNVMVGSKARPADYPPTNGVTAFPAAWEGVGFVDYAGGDYRIAPSSPYSAIGTDGKDPGADITTVLYRTRGCRTGIWT